MAAERWATVADVKALTNIDVTDAQRNQAAATIELHCGLIESVERTDISDRDRYWLKLATSYQAAWLAAQPDAFERNDVASAGQDGESASFRPDAHTLSPFARRALKKLSWRNGRVILPGGGGTGRLDTTSEEFDDSLAWKRV